MLSPMRPPHRATAQSAPISGDVKVPAEYRISARRLYPASRARYSGLAQPSRAASSIPDVADLLLKPSIAQRRSRTDFEPQFETEGHIARQEKSR